MRDKRKEFVEIINRNEGQIRKIAGFYILDLHNRQDLVQEIVYQLYRSFDSFKNQSAISTWIYRVAMNTAIYHVKRKKSTPVIVSIDEMNHEVPATENDETELQLRLMHDQIARLDLLEKGIIMLHLEGRNYHEIAELVGITATNVGTRISRIKIKLKQQLQNK